MDDELHDYTLLDCQSPASSKAVSYGPYGIGGERGESSRFAIPTQDQLSTSTSSSARSFTNLFRGGGGGGGGGGGEVVEEEEEEGGGGFDSLFHRTPGARLRWLDDNASESSKQGNGNGNGTE
ncbi:hypothetical protein MMC07_005016 [Pseudocyphellaria aurata]|nr:hypothetical protein [Pseudocyphellaria aurata]